MKTKKPETCPHCGTVNPLIEYHYFYGLESQRYRYPDRDRLYAGIAVARVLSYSLSRTGSHSEHIEYADFDAAFGEWLEWSLDGENAEFEQRQTSDHSWLSRARTQFLKDCLLACGCRVSFDLARDPSAAHLKIESVSHGCPAHGSITGWAMDMAGRCYVCEWPITPQAKANATKLNKRDETYQAVAIEEEQS